MPEVRATHPPRTDSEVVRAAVLATLVDSRDCVLTVGTVCLYDVVLRIPCPPTYVSYKELTYRMGGQKSFG